MKSVPLGSFQRSLLYGLVVFLVRPWAMALELEAGWVEFFSNNSPCFIVECLGWRGKWPVASSLYGLLPWHVNSARWGKAGFRILSALFLSEGTLSHKWVVRVKEGIFHFSALLFWKLIFGTSSLGWMKMLIPILPRKIPKALDWELETEGILCSWLYPPAEFF